MADDDELEGPVCRDDKCRVEGVHRAHDSEPESRRKVLTKCPVEGCGAPLIRLPTKTLRGGDSTQAQRRGRCSRCKWRGSTEIPASSTPRKGRHA